MTISKNGVNSEELSVSKPSAFRRILPQVIATTVKNLHMISWGLSITITSIMLPALTGIPNEQNQGEFLSITNVQASWLVSISHLTQIVGSLFSGVITDPIGRKLGMNFVNIPFALGWLLLYHASQIWHIFFGFSVLGLAIGLMESSVMTYGGEICEPNVRGILIAYSAMTFTAGGMIIYLLNASMSWRTIALVCLSVPITSAIALCFVPETPQWLLSKQRIKEAEKSLRWLRGWTTKHVIAHEFYELERHSQRSNACYSCAKQDLHCLHPPPTIAEKILELKRKQTIKPFFIIMIVFFLTQFTGAYAMRSFISQIFKAYESPIPIDKTLIALGFSDTLAKLVFLCLLRFSGKRRFICLTMLFGIFISSFLISCYGFLYLPRGFVSFDLKNHTFHLENPHLAYVPVVLLFVWNFCSFCGFLTMPWLMISELFPFKSRMIAIGLAGSFNFIFGFLSRKTYYNFEMALSMPGTSLLYSVISGVGFILLYFILPETENRTLEEIELHFADNSKQLTDRTISKKPQTLLTHEI